MNLQDLKDEFDRALAEMSDEDIVKAFAAMDCEVQVVAPDPEQWVECEDIPYQVSTRPLVETFLCAADICEISANCAADSDELALAA